MSTQVSELAAPTNQSPALPTAADPLVPLTMDSRTRLIIRQEIREMEERNKCKSCIIIRDLDTGDCNTSVAFGPIARLLTGESMPLSDVSCISRDKKLYGAKIANDTLRKTLLDNTRKLKDTAFSNVYVNRDLTYMQWTELQN